LMWTASGDDGSVGQSYAYDVRYALFPITPENFYDATRAQWSGPVQAGGNRQLSTVFSLQTATYYFAVRALDEAENASDMSNAVLAATSMPEQLTFQDTTLSLGDPDWSPDGRSIAYTTSWGGIYSYDLLEIYVMPAAGGASVRYTSALNNGAHGASWSPDGTRWALSIFPDEDSGRTAIGLVNAQPGAPYQIIADPGLPWRSVGGARWSPDGTRIVYTASTFNPPEAVGSIMYWVPSNGGIPQALVGDGTWTIGSPDWSPDGTRIVYSSNQVSSTYLLWVMPSSGGEPSRLTLSGGPYYSPRWSPDGRKIAYISGGRQIWIIYATGENATQVTFVSDKRANRLTWSPNSEYIAYSAYDATSTIPNLWRIRVK
jgi:Tol biopolymer transport system component